ncbi:MAG: hypothetical protein ACW98D_11585 [Promethearchaeota archaeon]
MRFISGLKNLSKKTILLVIVILFIVSWFLFIFALYVISNLVLLLIVLYFIGTLAVFTFILLIFSIFIPIDKMGIAAVLIAIVLTLPIMWLFSGIINLFYLFCFWANLVITAFFAYKFSMDTSTGIDDYLYKKKGSRKFTRILEFILLLLLYLWLLFLIIRFFRSSSNPSIQNLAYTFVFLLGINLILIGFVILRLILTRKLAAYIPTFFVLTTLYVLYLVIDLLAFFIFFGNTSYSIFSFLIDLLLFIYIIGSIFDRVDYIKDKLKVFRVGTLALFVILMKLVVQVYKILQPFINPIQLIIQVIMQLQVLIYFFILITLFVGFYTILTHKEGNKS